MNSSAKTVGLVIAVGLLLAILGIFLPALRFLLYVGIILAVVAGAMRFIVGGRT
jgi:hypothetical protein